VEASAQLGLKMKNSSVVFIIMAKIAIPFMIPFSPFIFGWLNFVLDTVDGDLLIPLGLKDELYQIIDKSADWLTYIGMVAAAHYRHWPIKKLIIALFMLRSVGQLLFLTTSDERLFFIFPNFLEPLFLIYASIEFFKKAAAAETYKKYRWLIFAFVFIYKMQDEYTTHIGNIDRSELISKLLNF
jgi:hypothetical protein